MGAVDDVFLLGAAFDDVEDPVEAAGVAVALHVGADVGAVDLGGFGDGAHALGGVFGDVFCGGGVDQVNLEGGRCW